MYTAIPWSEDVDAAEWVADALWQREGTVASVVPPLFDDYARVAPSGELEVDEHVAALTALLRRVSPAVGADPDRCRFALSTAHGGNGQGPDGGSGIVLSDADRAAYDTDRDAFLDQLHADIRAGRRPEPPGRRRELSPRLLIAETRDYMLYRGPVEALTAPRDAGAGPAHADLCWPEDRTWFLGGDTDMHHEFCLGGPAPLIEALLTEPAVRAWRVGPHER